MSGEAPRPQTGALGISSDGTRALAIHKDSRILNVASARSVFDTLYHDDRQRRAKRSQIRNQIEGGRPYDPKKLKSLGRSDACNHNFRDAEASAERAASPFWEMAHNVPNKASFSIKEDSPDNELHEQAIADVFDEWIDMWGMDYIIKFRKWIQEYIRFGVGYVLWEDDTSPRFKPLKASDVLAPKDTPLESDKWETMCIMDEQPVGWLWDKVKPENREAAEAKGWNIEMCEAAITKLGTGVLGRGSNSHRRDDWDYVQDEIKNNDITVSNTWPSINFVHILVREFDGSISHRIFIRDGLQSLATNPTGADPTQDIDGKGADLPKEEEANEIPEDYVYEELNVTQSFQEKLQAIFFEVGNGLVHGVNGHGQKNFAHGVMINRLKCKMVDGTNMSSSMNFQRTAEASDDNPPLESFGAVNVFPAGLQQLQYVPRMQESIAVLGMLEGGMNENNSQFRDQGQQIAEAETATSAMLLGELESQQSQANASLFLAQLSEVYQECFNRLRRKGNDHEDAKMFVQRLKDKQVPENVIHDSQILVGCGATSSMASPIQRQLMWTEMRQIARQTEGANVRFVDQMYFANKLGNELVKKILPANPAQTEASIIRDATLENLAMGQMQPMLVDMMDKHSVHLPVHLEVLEAIADSAEQGNPVSPDQLLAIQPISNHVEQHLEFMSQDTTRVEEFKVLNKRYNVVNQRLQALVNQAISQQAAFEADAQNQL